MKATELLDSINALLDHSNPYGALRLYNETRGKHPDLLSDRGWANLRSWIPDVGATCPKCGEQVVPRWLKAHLRNGCKGGEYGTAE